MESRIVQVVRFLIVAALRVSLGNAPTSFIEDLATYRVHGVRLCAPSFRHLAANGVTTQSR